MLDVLVHNEMQDILAVVVRYFGGIKLGTGGLVRAYSSSISQALKVATLTTVTTLQEYQIHFLMISLEKLTITLEHKTLKLLNNNMKKMLSIISLFKKIFLKI